MSKSVEIKSSSDPDMSLEIFEPVDGLVHFKASDVDRDPISCHISESELIEAMVWVLSKNDGPKSLTVKS